MRKVRLCLVGAGRAGLLHARNLAARVSGAELTSICDANPDALARVGGELGISACHDDYHAVLADRHTDAVVIAAPTFLHRDVACAAAAAGKHVFLEKPMALTVRECEEINAAVDRAGVKLQIGFMRRFDAGFARAKQIVDSGAMGRVMILKSTGRGPGGPGPWMYDLSKSNGIIAEVNSHDLDSLLWFAGCGLRRVYAEAHNFKCPDARRDHPEFYDNVVVSFRFADGALGMLDGTCPAGYGYDARFEVLCEKGLLLVGSTRQQGVTQITLDGQICAQAVGSWRSLFKEAYHAEMEHFVHCIREDAAPCVTGQDGLKAVAAVVAVNESIRRSRPVELMQGTAA